MAVADITNPKVTQDYTTLLASIRDLFISQAALHDATGIVGLTSGAIRFSGANVRFEKFDGTTWNALSLNIPGNAANVTGIVAGANGGTGVANTGKTLTLGGNLALAGAFNSTFTMTGATGVTFPTSGTLLSTAAAVTVAQGGTGASTAAAALTALGAVAKAGDGMSGNLGFDNNVGVFAKDAGGTSRLMLRIISDNNMQMTVAGGQNLNIYNQAGNTILWSLSNAGDVNMVGNQTMANSKSFSLRDTGGTARQFFSMGSDNATNLIVAGGTSLRFLNQAGDTAIANLTNAGTFSAVVVTQTSDERKKKKWQRLPDDFIASLAGIRKSGLFQWKKGGAAGLGVGAQSLEAFLPQAVHTDAKGQKTVNYGGAALVASVELARKVIELEARLAALEGA
jgi:hypothetical protein